MNNAVTKVKDVLLFISLVLLVILLGREGRSTVSHYECQGYLTEEGLKSPKLVYMRLERYRWWLSQLRENDGEMTLELPRLMVFFYDSIRDGEVQIRVFNEGSFKGAFSTISGTLAISMAANFFEGICRQRSQSKL